MTQQERDLARSLGLKRNTGDAYYRRALKEYEAGNLEEAIVDVSEAIFYDQGYAEYYTTRGIFYIADNKKAEAEADFQYALKLNRRQWLAHYGLGMVRFQDGDYLAAVDRFTEALRHPDAGKKPEIWYYRAIALHAQNDDERAYEDIDRAIDRFSAEDKRLSGAKAWKREIEAKIPKSMRKSSKPVKPKAAKETVREKKDAKSAARGEVPIKDLADTMAIDAKNAPLPEPKDNK
jgi:tetratricopeptide (TPR) repeat protein